jgi:translation initiation factor 2B subunit (eIF-2B alpha/beta/delta family)
MINNSTAALAADHSSGASALAARAAEILYQALTPDTVPDEIQELGVALLHAQPAIAPIARLVSTTLRALESGGPDSARRAIRRQQSEVRTAMGKLTSAGAEQVQPFVKILTHSASSAVREILLAAHAKQVRFSVTCLESRPLSEGIELARALTDAGIQVTLAVDAAMGLAVGESDAIMLGADTLSPTGLVHKIGTWPLCLAANELGVAVFVMSTPDKLLPDPVKGALEQNRPPFEVLPETETGLKVWNRAFDFTPLDLLDGIFVGGDLLEPDEAADRARRVRVHPIVQAELRSPD